MATCFAWVEGRAARPAGGDPAPFRPPMLSHAIEEADLAALDPAAFLAEWKWDGIRVQAVAGPRLPRAAASRASIRARARTFPPSFPDLVDALGFDGAVDGELLIVRDGRVQSFNVLQQRLNRKTVTPKLLAEFPAHLRAYDLLVEGDADLRDEAFALRARGWKLVASHWRRAHLAVAAGGVCRLGRACGGAGRSGAPPGRPRCRAIEGVMIKRRDSPYLPGRPKGMWWKWKRDPFTIDAVLMYAQHGHGKRSSFYSDYTFGVWAAGVGGRTIGAGRQGLFRLHGCRARRTRPLRPRQHGQSLRTNSRSRPRTRSRPGIRSGF